MPLNAARRDRIADILSARAQRAWFRGGSSVRSERAVPAGGQDVRAPSRFTADCSSQTHHPD